MATRSNIAYKTAEGKIRSVYCHWDGYPAYNGEVLSLLLKSIFIRNLQDMILKILLMR